ncbi:MAG: chemotaxis protein CheW [Myxococcota bacterium]
MSETGPTTPVGGSWEDLARSARSVEVDGEGQEDLRQLLTFEVDATPYAVAVERVREIVRIRPITPVPRMPADVRGVISLRGEIVEVIDLRRRLDLAPVEPVRSTRIIVVNSEDGRIAGLLVDAVREVFRVSEDAIQAANSSETEAVEALCVRGDEFISLIDLDRILQIDARH